VELASGDDYRARVESIPEPAGPPVERALLQGTSSLSDTISENRLVIGGLLVAFLLLAMLAAAGVSRALTGQIGTFLDGARRLARGDFAHPVPVTGRDEFAQLGHEFNSMSSQLEAKIEEITASFGVAAVPQSATDEEQLVAAADAALYRAKRGGKNRVERAERVAAAR
jgi:methyl-accepting chemotaxis protein